MTQKIHILSKQLANQIAAGEVVERPLSVVKELVENSIDAGADEIIVRLEEGGCRLIEVQDNGEWISPEDLELILEKYSTSKIENIQDLYQIMSFGFRWEALASISSVSEFSIISKTADMPSGKKLFSQGGESQDIIDVACDTGTKVRVENLFFNTPARLSYLKKPRTEYMRIQDFLGRMTLAYPDIAFQLFHDERQIFSFPANQDPKQRIYEIFWNDVYENLLEISHEFDGICLSGYITDPKVSFVNRNRQVIFVNGRLITSPIIAKALSDAYNRFIAPKEFPSYVLFLSLDPSQVDVNVHPRKMELRFAQEQSIFRSVYHGVKNALERVSLVSEWSQDLSPNLSWQAPSSHTISYPQPPSSKEKEVTPQYYTGSGTKFKNYSPYTNTQANPAQEAMSFSKAILWTGSLAQQEESPNILLAENETPLGKIIGQVHNSYIVVETADGIKILDQHALAERVIYEQLANAAYIPKIQWLLGGIPISLNMQEREACETYKESFEQMWFEIEIFPWGSIMIQAVPDFVSKKNIEKVFREILDDISSEGSKSLDEIRHKIWAYTACRSAIKFWDPLNMMEMKQLLIDASLDYSATCPHGRPVIWEMNLEELQKKYER